VRAGADEETCAQPKSIGGGLLGAKRPSVLGLEKGRSGAASIDAERVGQHP